MICNLIWGGGVGVIWLWFTGVLGLYIFFFLCFMACMISLSKFQLLGVFSPGFCWLGLFLGPFTRLDAIP